ncbi:MAG: preprotein translocase subunit SecE [Tannerella sp.]|jgi:preprotein translocase subunit SecE|nr:preprotein translocase subunit SecE [Tannerella sp.]
MERIIAYFRDSYNELVHKVSWPTRKELSSSAVVVMFASLVIAVLILLIDSAFDGIMKFIY